MKGDLGMLMRQAQRMQDEMQKAQDELGDVEVTGEAGAGLVKLTMTCRHEVRELVLDDSLLGEDREMLEDVIVAAFNDALRRVEKKTADHYSGFASGLGLPPGIKLPF